MMLIIPSAPAGGSVITEYYGLDDAPANSLSLVVNIIADMMAVRTG